MALNFVKISDLLDRGGAKPYNEMVSSVRLRFPGRRHAFDEFIQQLTPLAEGFFHLPQLSDDGRSWTIRNVLSETARGNKPYFKPVLIRWFWTYDEAWMREFLHRWSEELGWTRDEFVLPQAEAALQERKNEPAILFAYPEGAQSIELSRIVARLEEKSIGAELYGFSNDLGEIATRLHNLGPAILTVYFSTSSAPARWPSHDESQKFQKARTYILQRARNLIVLRDVSDDGVISRWSTFNPAYLETQAGVPSVVLSLEQAAHRLRRSPEAFSQFYDTLGDKNAGQLFLERGLEEIAKTNPAGIAVALFDIDMTNQINRRFGEEVGDTVIAETRKLIAEKLDHCHSDVGRCGDDTFYAAIYDGSDHGTVIKHLVSEISQFDWSEIAPDLRVTCSAGYAARVEDEALVDVVVRAALGLTKARENGGNQLQRGPLTIPNATSRYIRRHFS